MLLQLFYSSLPDKMFKNPRRRHSQLRPLLPGGGDGGHSGGPLLGLHPGLPAAAGPAQVLYCTVLYCTVLYLLLLARHRRDPVVQKSGTHFLPFLFGGALLCQLSGILFLNARLGPGTCSLLQLLSGLSPTIMFAAILVKTRKVYVIFEKQMKDMANR